VPEQKTPQAAVEWTAVRLSGSDALAVRATKRLRSDELLVTTLGSTILRKHLDDVPLWRGDHVGVKQLVEDFARYLYLPRVAGPEVVVQAIRSGVNLTTWHHETFAVAESYDEGGGRYRGLRAGQMVDVSLDSHALVVKPDVARRQMDIEVAPTLEEDSPERPPDGDEQGDGGGGKRQLKPAALARRFHGSVTLDTTRVGRDAGRIAEEVIAHLAGLVGADVTITLEIQADVPSGTPENIVRIVTENCRTLKFSDHGFESE
jgi:hypothetical protein